MSEQRCFVPTQALAQALDFNENVMRLLFTDGRVLSVLLKWFPRLRQATPAQRRYYEIGGGVSLHWPELNEDLSIAGLMVGMDWNAGLIQFWASHVWIGFGCDTLRALHFALDPKPHLEPHRAYILAGFMVG